MSIFQHVQIKSCDICVNMRKKNRVSCGIGDFCNKDTIFHFFRHGMSL